MTAGETGPGAACGCLSEGATAAGVLDSTPDRGEPCGTGLIRSSPTGGTACAMARVAAMHASNETAPASTAPGRLDRDRVLVRLWGVAVAG